MAEVTTDIITDIDALLSGDLSGPEQVRAVLREARAALAAMGERETVLSGYGDYTPVTVRAGTVASPRPEAVNREAIEEAIRDAIYDNISGAAGGGYGWEGGKDAVKDAMEKLEHLGVVVTVIKSGHE